MNYLIDKNAPTPAYLQLYAALRGAIAEGVYPYGSRLPSKRLLSAETGLSVITVEHAMSLLCEEGYAEARERSGLYVAYRSADFHPLPALEQTVLPSRTEPTRTHTGSFPFGVLSRTMRQVLQDYGERILDRSPNRGCAELIGELAAYLGRSRGIHVAPEQIVVGSGAEYLYGFIAQLLCRDGRIAVENPSYDQISKVYQANGVECDFLTMGSDGILSQELSRTTARVLHTTPFHSYPSGITASISKKLEYLRWAEERQGFIIEDNYDSELTIRHKAEEPLFSMTRGGNVVYLNTFSKTVAPSLRVGYMLLPEGLVEEFERTLGFYSCTVPVFEQYVLARLLRGGDYERNINRIRRARRQGQAGGEHR